jgi:fermentation-respiration switch protein FrsA (DUF1100 family)
MVRGDGTRRTVRAACAAVLAVGLLALTPSASGAAATTKPLPVRHVTMTFVDHTRKTVDPVGTRSAPTRTLVTQVYVPRGRGPWPLVVMAHGNAGDPAKLSELLTAWAQAGYVVAAPTFPLTNDLSGQPTVIPDYVNQPGDVSFVIDQMLRQSKQHGSAVFHHVDASRIGIAGHSLGGATIYGVGFNACCRDRRVDAVIAMDAVRLPFGTHRFDFRRHTPLLLIHIRGDPVVSYSFSQDVYDAASPPKYLMTLTQGIHFEPYENAPSPHDAAVMAATTTFWNAYLKGRVADRRRVVAAGTQPGLSSVTAKLR